MRKDGLKDWSRSKLSKRRKRTAFSHNYLLAKERAVKSEGLILSPLSTHVDPVLTLLGGGASRGQGSTLEAAYTQH